ncbi:uncharacterized protein LOC115254900 [Aedes albopictus]|uniref:PHD-type domain-containing protein n=1 Tax=Aedes albopictus TaxID=7160 RepID=A0ABM1Y2D2_AEDAL
MSKKSAIAETNTGTSMPGHADGYDHGVAGTAAIGSSTTPPVTIASSPSTGIKVNVDVANNNVAGATGLNSENPVNIGQSNIIANTGSAHVIRRNPLREVRRNVEYRCQLCGKRDSEEMVQCDGCDRWFHFACVHVAEDIANVSWMCPICKASSFIVPPTNTNRIVEKQRNLAPPSKITSIRSNSKASSRSEAKRLKELEMKQLEEEFELEKRFLERKYKLLKECVSETSSVTEESVEGKLSKIEEWLAETERHGEAEDSGLVAEVANEHTPNSTGKLEEHHAPEVQRNLHPSILRSSRRGQRLAGNQPFSSVQQSIQQDQPIPSTSATRPQYNRLSQGVHYANSTQLNSVHILHQNERCQAEGHQRHSAYPQSYGHPRVVSSSLPEMHYGQYSRDLPGGQPCRQLSARREFVSAVNPNLVNEFVPGQRSTPIRSAQQDSGSPVFDDETVCVLNRSQIAARQAVSRDLPDFDGSLEDWPLFYAMFNSSTQMCGFTNEENMLRLRKCLKGNALEAVKCELLHPSNVGDILSTLKMLYGRPDAIIQSIVKKIRHLPQPNTEKLESLVNFALTVKNMVATIRACEVNDFIFNASLRYE